jgi:predicted HicB family RNase H-like nuclease
MNLRVNNLDDALHAKAKVLAAKKRITLRQLVINLLQAATKSTK